MLLGFNTNYRHRGVLFHVQTEDSGRGNPHVITHLFYGGNIIASVKRDYSDRLDTEDLEATVRALMERQHKEMLKQLSRSEHDSVILQRLGPHIFGDSTDTADTLPPVADAAPETPPAGPAAAPPPPPAARAAAESGEPTETPLRPTAAVGHRDRIRREFGDSVVTEKPLDEVVLDYLVENARKRKRTGK
jgi:hypothetical protein